MDEILERERRSKKRKRREKAMKAANRAKQEKQQLKRKKKQGTDVESPPLIDCTKKNKILRIYSDSEDDDVPLNLYKHVEITKPKKGDYVIVKYEGEYFPGIIENTDDDFHEISTMTFSSGNSFRWPEQSDKIWYHQNDIQEKITVPILANTRGFYRIPEMDKFMPKV